MPRTTWAPDTPTPGSAIDAWPTSAPPDDLRAGARELQPGDGHGRPLARRRPRTRLGPRCSPPPATIRRSARPAAEPAQRTIQPDQRGDAATFAFHQGPPVDVAVNSR